MVRFISCVVLAAKLAWSVHAADCGSFNYNHDCTHESVSQQTRRLRKASALDRHRRASALDRHLFVKRVKPTASMKNQSDSLQPLVTIVEQHPPTLSIGSISLANGSPWCSNAPTYWLVGHEARDAPWCQQSNKTWTRGSLHVEMDYNDALNAAAGHARIDRHDCITMLVNNDTLPDIICSVGAKKGLGEGFNELYLTNANGTIRKVLKGHGLQKYPTTSTRITRKLRGPGGAQLVFIGTTGNHRADGKPNQHRMFRNDFVREDVLPYFNEVHGPFAKYFGAICAVPADITGNGIDDLVVCDKKGSARVYTQSMNGKWSQLSMNPSKQTTAMLKNWQNVRITDLNQDGYPDLIVSSLADKKNSMLRVFAGIQGSPFFDFDKPMFEQKLPFIGPNLELLDINRDGLYDIYVSQYDHLSHNYCSARFNASWSDPTFTPPMSKVPDLLFVGQTTKSQQPPFRMVSVDLEYPGCSHIAERFGNNYTMILARGDFVRAGPNLLLEWVQ
jgi:hypothetical protein